LKSRPCQLSTHGRQKFSYPEKIIQQCGCNDPDQFRNQFQRSIQIVKGIEESTRRRGRNFSFLIRQFRGGAIVAPGPPGGAALALVKLLPLAALLFGVDRRSAVDPHLLGRLGSGVTLGTAEVSGVDGGLSPTGREGRKGFHGIGQQWLTCEGTKGATAALKPRRIET
jgi:hypothetical protein